MKIFKTPYIFRLLFPDLIWGFSFSKPEIYLTFDDGPQPEVTPLILDLLKKHEVVATFFCVGENVLKYPDIYQRILDEGHQVGNHTMSHNKGRNSNNNSYFESIKNASQLIESKLYRPPYGSIKKSQIKFLKKDYKIIMWSWLSYDYDHSVSIERIIQNARRNIKNGAILVFHDNIKSKYRSTLLVDQIVPILKEKQFTFKRIE